METRPRPRRTKPNQQGWTNLELGRRHPDAKRGHGVSNLLDDLERQSWGPQVDIWVVDDHSEDDTLRVASDILWPNMDTSGWSATMGLAKIGHPHGHGARPAFLGGHLGRRRAAAPHLGGLLGICPEQVSRETAAISGPVVLLRVPKEPGLWDGVQLDSQLKWGASQLKLPAQPQAQLGPSLRLYSDTRHLGASGDDTLVVQTLQQGRLVDWLSDPKAIVTTPGAASVSNGWRNGFVGLENETLSPAYTTHRVVDGLDGRGPVGLVVQP